MTGRKTFSYKYERPALMVDAVVFGLNVLGRFMVLLIKRKSPPFKGRWALPGGHVEKETLEQAVARELLEETGVRELYLEQVGAFSALGRDPREWTVSMAFMALLGVNVERVKLSPETDADDAQWFQVNDLPKLAFDHQEILSAALEKLRDRVRREPVIFQLMPETFSIGQLAVVYSQILGFEVDASNLRRDLKKMGILEEVGESPTWAAHRPPKMFRFNKREYEKRRREGLGFHLGLKSGVGV